MVLLKKDTAYLVEQRNRARKAGDKNTEKVLQDEINKRFSSSNPNDRIGFNEDGSFNNDAFYDDLVDITDNGDYKDLPLWAKEDYNNLPEYEGVQKATNVQYDPNEQPTENDFIGEDIAPWLNKEKPNMNSNDSNVDYENMFADVDDSDVNLGADIENSSNNTGITTNPAIPTEPGYNNDAVKDRAEKEYTMAQNNNVIGISEDPNKTNYVNDDWNQGMVEKSTDVVSDERCKKFMSSVVHHEPAMRNGFKKIVTIIRK